MRIDDCSCYADGTINRDVRAIVQESVDWTEIYSGGFNVREAFSKEVMETFSGLSCYVYVTWEKPTAVQRFKGILNFLSERCRECVKSVHEIDEGDRWAVVLEYAVEDMPSVVEILWKNHFGSRAVIDEKGRSDAASEFMNFPYATIKYETFSSMVNLGCERHKAYLVCINGSDGVSLCCFSLFL